MCDCAIREAIQEAYILKRENGARLRIGYSIYQAIAMRIQVRWGGEKKAIRGSAAPVTNTREGPTLLLWQPLPTLHKTRQPQVSPSLPVSSAAFVRFRKGLIDNLRVSSSPIARGQKMLGKRGRRGGNTVLVGDHIIFIFWIDWLGVWRLVHIYALQLPAH